ncbi:hypothetical protein QW131_31545 [Roseibium salinum]|nr:hypothetical protein [Roseibium salinum]
MSQQTDSNRLAQVMSAVRRQFPALVVLSCLVNLLLLVTSIYMLQVYDRVLSSGSMDTLLWLTVIAVFAVAVYSVLEQSRRMILSRAAGWLDSELNAPMLRRAMEVRLAGKRRARRHARCRRPEEILRERCHPGHSRCSLEHHFHRLHLGAASYPWCGCHGWRPDPPQPGTCQ